MLSGSRRRTGSNGPRGRAVASAAKEERAVAVTTASIVFTNHDHGRFVAQAIDSALAQTHAAVEVVVVDDGSTDESRRIIAGYQTRRVRCWENGGQAPAIKAGFAESCAEVVLFLDSDDILYPDAVSRITSRFGPRIAKVQGRLDLIDDRGHGLGRQTPPLAMPSGDLLAVVLRHGWNPCASHERQRVRESRRWRRCCRSRRATRGLSAADGRLSVSDHYLSVLAPFRGGVVSLPEPLGAYRIHAARRTRQRSALLADVRRRIERTAALSGIVRRWAEQRELPASPTSRWAPPITSRSAWPPWCSIRSGTPCRRTTGGRWCVRASTPRGPCRGARRGCASCRASGSWRWRRCRPQRSTGCCSPPSSTTLARAGEPPRRHGGLTPTHADPRAPDRPRRGRCRPDRGLGRGRLPAHLQAPRGDRAPGAVENPFGLFVGALWPSFSTGVSPTRHGLVLLHPARAGTYLHRATNCEEVQGTAFWASLSRAGRRAAIVDVPKASATSGGRDSVLILDWGSHEAEVDGGFRTSPPSLARSVLARYGPDPVGTCDLIHGQPEEYERLRERLLARIALKTRMIRDVVQEGDWDLVVACFADTHCAGHQLWNLHAGAKEGDTGPRGKRTARCDARRVRRRGSGPRRAHPRCRGGHGVHRPRQPWDRSLSGRQQDPGRHPAAPRRRRREGGPRAARHGRAARHLEEACARRREARADHGPAAELASRGGHGAPPRVRRTPLLRHPQQRHLRSHPAQPRRTRAARARARRTRSSACAPSSSASSDR